MAKIPGKFLRTVAAKGFSLSTAGFSLTAAGGFLLTSAGAYAADDAQLELESFWVRAMPPTQQMTAGYGTVTNTGSTAVTITGISADFAPMAEMHETVSEGDSVRMVAMQAPQLAPGASLRFVPGGAHVMLMGIEQMPAANSQVEICLLLDDGTESCTNAPVLRSAPDHAETAGDAMNGHDHHSKHH